MIAPTSAPAVGNLRCAIRNWNDPGNRNTNIGFRPASPSHRPIVPVVRVPPAIGAQCT